MQRISLLALVLLTACSSGRTSTGNADDTDPGANVNSNTNSNTNNNTNNNSNSNDSGAIDPNDPIAASQFATPAAIGTAQSGESAFATRASTARFLTQASFGPRPEEIDAFVGRSESAWFRDQLARPPSLILPRLNAYENIPVDDMDDDYPLLAVEAPTMAFWRNAATGGDQLRQRVAFALSQILVVSNFGGEVLTDIPHGVAYAQDLLIQNAFGNYRDILDRITYSPAMGHYLTYMGNQRADPVTGRRPDENYAREIMQLFSIGVVMLQPNGEPVFDNGGNMIETYTNADITELAKVFTGLNILIPEDFADPDDADFLDVRDSWALPMLMSPEFHSPASKTFLGQTIPENTGGSESITQALDIIFAHQNVAPFIGRQLIQRLVTSDPAAAYIGRVSAAFNAGTYTLPDGSTVGTGRRGDMTATVAAVLFDSEARGSAAANGAQFGKLREPVIRLVNWMRAFNVGHFAPEYLDDLYDTLAPNNLAQHAYRAKSVFNFYRPGYVPTSSLSGSAGLTVPEFQIVNATSTPGYINFMTQMIFREPVDAAEDPEAAARFDSNIIELFENSGSVVNLSVARQAMMPNYTAENSLADNPTQLVDRLDELLVYGSMPPDKKASIAEMVGLVDADQRAQLAVLLVMTSPEYLIQR